MAKPTSWLVDLAVDFAVLLLALAAGATVNWVLGVNPSTAFTLGLIGGASAAAVNFALRVAIAKGAHRP